MSIADDPSSWTSKPKDMFGDKVKQSLDNRGWGSVDTSVGDPLLPSQGGGHSLADYKLLRRAVHDIASYAENEAKLAKGRGEALSAGEFDNIAHYLRTRLSSTPKDGSKV